MSRAMLDAFSTLGKGPCDGCPSWDRCAGPPAMACHAFESWVQKGKWKDRGHPSVEIYLAHCHGPTRDAGTQNPMTRETPASVITDARQAGVLPREVVT